MAAQRGARDGANQNRSCSGGSGSRGDILPSDADIGDFVEDKGELTALLHDVVVRPEIFTMEITSKLEAQLLFRFMSRRGRVSCIQWLTYKASIWPYLRTAISRAQR